MDAWPLFDLRITTPRLELRVVRDHEMDALVDSARHIDGAPGVFLGDWAGLADPAFGRSIVQYQWRTRAEWSVAEWNLPLGVFVDDQVVGIQDIGAKDFSRLREVSTGSWLTTPMAGQGIGTEMRAAVLHFAFDGLGALVARSSARDSNIASQRVSQKLGYRSNGSTRIVFGDGEIAPDLALELDRSDWDATRAAGFAIHGFDGCRDLFMA